MLSFVGVLPAIDPSLAHACLASMHPEIRRRVLVVDNTGLGRIAHVHRKVVGAVHAAAENLGVSRSWALGVKQMFERDAEYLLIVSQSITFDRPLGGLDFLAEMEGRRPPVLIHAQFGWKLVALHRSVFELVGSFDPWFAPAYYEESEYMVRMHHAGLPSPLYNDGRFDQITVDATSAGDGVTMHRGLVRIDYGAQKAKFVAKWGCEPGGRPFDHPYNDERLDFTFVGDYDTYRRQKATTGVPDER